ncbi:isochorismatase domain-containing protein 2 isoform X2 [Marmota monax]|uniref:isochorismatase domain-containing protein 2 isoform X4 n=1 Tax=Marmota marmota marmota TaxID=9994 RepID=UPI002093C953|nr:isochorismatase domain-containing protein 2 isoform X4 [Marmota marmota marmota]XP_058430754.1 isochorismatase domain-containing protein 2 isoform X2 [Marmota monax]
MAAARTSLGRVLPGSSILFLCDMQERFRHSIVYFPQIVSVAARMLRVARLLQVPALLTEQYPQGLGPTVPELGAEGLQPVSKTCFSMVPTLQRELDSRPQLQSVLLCGIEAQVCILHTTLDLLERGLQVHIVVDACSSRSQVDRLTALARMRQSGAFLSTSEGLIMQLVRDAAHPKFREVVTRSWNVQRAMIGHLEPKTWRMGTLEDFLTPPSLYRSRRSLRSPSRTAGCWASSKARTPFSDESPALT